MGWAKTVFRLGRLLGWLFAKLGASFISLSANALLGLCCKEAICLEARPKDELLVAGEEAVEIADADAAALFEAALFCPFFLFAYQGGIKDDERKISHA